jgi:hypothetical protein
LPQPFYEVTETDLHTCKIHHTCLSRSLPCNDQAAITQKPRHCLSVPVVTIVPLADE